jgi:hypothetical protein
MLPRDRNHQSSLEWLAAAARTDVLAGPMLPLPESGGPIARETDDPSLALEIVSTLQRLPFVRLFPIGESLARFSADLAAVLRIRAADAFYVALASRMNIPLVTWDNQQLERGRRAATTVTPADLLSGTSPA